MYKYLYFFLFISITTFCQEHSKMKVMVLGTFHFGESEDFQQTDIDDLLGKKRQKELRNLRKDLSKFNPDKIFVENTPQFQGYWNNVYTKYKAGQEPSDERILKNEIYQLGIKLASEMNAENGVLCVNYLLNEPQNNYREPTSRAFEYYKSQVNKRRPSYSDFFSRNSLAKSSLNSFLANHEKWKELNLSEHLVEMNREENLRQLHYFNVLSWMDNNENGVGTDLTSLEYYRNLQIVQNIYKNLKPSDKNLLIIVGAAHAQILKDMLKSHPVFEVVEVEAFLK
ncbi:hypothetical protein SAMN06298216_3137 [Spirosomataceae bacterium TFI 002]|nr:hypothetical protein SAMN06298216_3137 [Spirosomataceae bacterium TFI 002]